MSLPLRAAAAAGWALTAASALGGCALSHQRPARDAAAGDAPARDSGTLEDVGCGCGTCGASRVCVEGSCRDLAPRLDWASSFRAGSGSALAVTFSPAGALAVGGYVFDGADLGLGHFDAGSRGDAVVAVLERDGTPRWVRSFPGDAAQVSALALDEGGVWAAGAFGSYVRVFDHALSSRAVPDGFLARIGANGEDGGAVSIDGASDDRIMSVLSRGDEVLVAGYYVAPATLGAYALPGAGGMTGFVARTALDDVHWIRDFDALGLDVVYEVAALRGGDLVVSGLRSSTRASDRLPPAAGGFDAVVLRLDPGGDVVWARQIGGTGDEIPRALTSDGGENLYLGCVVDRGELVIGDARIEHQGSLLISLDPADGAVRWARVLDHDETIAPDLAVDAGGDAIAALSFAGSSDADAIPALDARGRHDILVAIYAPDGRGLWAESVGGPGDDWMGAVAADDCGAFAIAGSYADTAEIGPVVLDAPRNNDGFVARFVE